MDIDGQGLPPPLDLDSPVLPPPPRGFWFSLGGALVCIVCAAIAAGLTVGLVSLDPLEMEIKRRVGTPKEKMAAETICPLIRRRHLLLSLITLPVILSVTTVLIFGEIIPTVIFTGPRQTTVVSYLSGLVYLLIALLYPIAKPIAWFLDRCFGKHALKCYTREELSALVELQHEYGACQLHRNRSSLAISRRESVSASITGHVYHNLPISTDEATIVSGVLHYHSKTVADIMTEVQDLYSLHMDQVLDEDTMIQIVAKGFSRIPIFDRGPQDLRGFLLVKRLILVNWGDNRVIRTLPIRRPVVVAMNQPLLELINIFQEGDSHLAFVAKNPILTRQALNEGKGLVGDAAPVGIVTLEDLFEQMLQEDIYDEDDRKEKKALESLRRIRQALKYSSSSLDYDADSERMPIFDDYSKELPHYV